MRPGDELQRLRDRCSTGAADIRGSQHIHSRRRFGKLLSLPTDRSHLYAEKLIHTDLVKVGGRDAHPLAVATLQMSAPSAETRRVLITTLSASRQFDFTRQTA